MRLHFAWLPLVLLELGAGAVLAQGIAVQLPTYSFFGTSTTVSVPDRGSVYMGGVKYAQSGMNQFGAPLLPFSNRSFGTSRSASSARVSVFIHDFDAMDEYLLSRPTASNPNGLLPPVAAGLRQRFDAARGGSAGQPVMSIAELRAKHLQEQQTRQKEAVKFFQRGRTAEVAGKGNVARIYYQMAARRASGQLRAEIAARLHAISKPARYEAPGS